MGGELGAPNDPDADNSSKLIWTSADGLLLGLLAAVKPRPTRELAWIGGFNVESNGRGSDTCEERGIETSLIAFARALRDLSSIAVRSLNRQLYRLLQDAPGRILSACQMVSPSLATAIVCEPMYPANNLPE